MSSDPFSVLVKMDSEADTVGRETHSGKRPEEMAGRR